MYICTDVCIIYSVDSVTERMVIYFFHYILTLVIYSYVAQSLSGFFYLLFLFQIVIFGIPFACVDLILVFPFFFLLILLSQSLHWLPYLIESLFAHAFTHVFFFSFATKQLSLVINTYCRNSVLRCSYLFIRNRNAFK